MDWRVWRGSVFSGFSLQEPREGGKEFATLCYYVTLRCHVPSLPESLEKMQCHHVGSAWVEIEVQVRGPAWPCLLGDVHL